MFTAVVVHGLLLVLIVSGIPLLACCVSGLIVSVVQAATQVQEQSLSYLVRFLTACGSLWLLGDWFLSQLIAYIDLALRGITHLGRM